MARLRFDCGWVVGSVVLLAGWLQVGSAVAQPRPAEAVDPFGAPAAADQAPNLAPPQPRRQLERRAPIGKAAGPGATGPGATRPGSGSRERDALPASRQRIEMELGRATNLDVVEMPLKDIVVFLSESHNIPIRLNLKKLEAASVSPDVPITKSYKNISLRAALDNLLGDLELAYYATELLVITTPEDAATHTEVRVYDCRDLLAGQADGEIDPTRAVRLTEMLQNNVMPETWRDNASGRGMGGGAMGGRPKAAPPGVISEFDGLLIVTQTEQVHREVASVLNLLREVGGLEPRVGRVMR